MSTEPQHQGRARQTDEEKVKPAVRQPYQKPAFRYERVFEMMALSCGKISSTQSACKFVRKTS